MNQAIKEQWVAALRSGEYEQGREQLRDGDQFCCLGVLCDLAARQGLGSWVGHRFHAGHETNAGAFLHPVVADWAGLDHLSPKVVDTPLIAYNDGDDGEPIGPHTFAEIADLIETHL